MFMTIILQLTTGQFMLVGKGVNESNKLKSTWQYVICISINWAYSAHAVKQRRQILHAIWSLVYRKGANYDAYYDKCEGWRKTFWNMESETLKILQ